MDNNNSLKWRFDISTFRLIGRDLITDRITALFELIKNCYDANASLVTVTFSGFDENHVPSSIIIEDDGFGMSIEDIRDKWMVIGTPHKRKQKITPAPYYRRCVGEKGIGRFAVDKLGDKVTISSQKENSETKIEVIIDWTEYFQGESTDGIILFTDVENSYTFLPSEFKGAHGTTLKIENIREPWLKNDIERFIKEASSLVSPFTPMDYSMKIRVIASYYELDQYANKAIEDTDIATASFKLSFDKIKNIQQYVEFNEETKKFDIKETAIKSFGGIIMSIFYFDDSARKKYKREFHQSIVEGIKIYRDGIITTPFADTQDDNDKKRDILGIDKRLWKDVFNRVSSREIMGVVDITKDGNPEIIDATNRQDFVDNTAYRELKDFIIQQLDAIEKYKIFKRKQKKEEDISALKSAPDDVAAIISFVKNISKDNPALEKSLKPLIEQAKKIGKTVKEALLEKENAEKEFERKENIYMSIMSLQEYAIHITHAVRTTLNKLRDKVNFFELFYPDPTEEELFILYSKEMSKDFQTLNRIIDYMLSYSQSSLVSETVNITDIILEVINGYDQPLKTKGIITDLNLEKNIVLNNTNKVFFKDIFQNLIDNSIKALTYSKQKVIKISLYSTQEALTINFSDTGSGIPKDRRKWVFGLYNTTTEEQGGAGIGLYIVKTRTESLKGDVFVNDSEFGDKGTTITINLPFNKH